MDDGGRHSQGHGNPPDHVIRTDPVVQVSSKPRAQETANLVTEEYEAKERGQVFRAENLKHDSGGQWDCGEP